MRFGARLMVAAIQDATFTVRVLVQAAADLVCNGFR